MTTGLALVTFGIVSLALAMRVPKCLAMTKTVVIRSFLNIIKELKS